VAARCKTLGEELEATMPWRKQLAAILVMLALAGCVEGLVTQGRTRSAPYSPENYGNMRDSGGVDGGGSGM
jgi:hypothetical protein